MCSIRDELICWEMMSLYLVEQKSFRITQKFYLILYCDRIVIYRAWLKNTITDWWWETQSSEMTQYEKNSRFCSSHNIALSSSQQLANDRAFSVQIYCTVFWCHLLDRCDYLALIKTRMSILQKCSRKISVYNSVYHCNVDIDICRHSKIKVNNNYLKLWKRVIKPAIEEQKTEKKFVSLSKILN